ncbi:MAG: EamA family transporter [Deferribacterales bacterium]|nr:EamA family transporter [Deferribacterales bacterium]
MTSSSHLIRGIICTLAGAVCWGFSGACGQYLFTYKNIEPDWLTVVRMITAGLILITFGMPKYGPQFLGILKNKSDRKRLVIFSIFGLMTCQYSYLTAVANSNAGTATVLQYLEPILVMIFVCFRIKKAPSSKEITAVILAVIGVFLIATHGNIHSLAISGKGLLWGLMAAITAAACSILPVNIIRRWGSTVVTGYGMLIGGIFLFVATAQWNTPVLLDMESIAGIAIISIVGTAAAFTLFLRGVSDIGPVKGTIIGSVEPVSAAIFTFIWLNTSFTLMDAVAFVCILSAVPILTYGKT